MEATEDFERLFIFGIDNFGLKRAIIYSEGMEHRFAELSKTPLLWPSVKQIHKDYRRSVYNSHSIYYRITFNSVEIIRILGSESRESLN